MATPDIKGAKQAVKADCQKSHVGSGFGPAGSQLANSLARTLVQANSLIGEQTKMGNRTKFLLAALTAALVLSIAAGTAGALRSLSLNPAGAIRATSSGAITFNAGETSVNSAVTLSGSLNRAIAKRRGAILGTITTGTSGPCTAVAPVGATCVIRPGPLPREPAWNILYNSILGTLPVITGILVIVERATFLLELTIPPTTINCLITAEFGALAVVERRGGFNVFTILRERPINVTVRELEPVIGACPRPETIELRGAFAIAPTQTVRLI